MTTSHDSTSTRSIEGRRHGRRAQHARRAVPMTIVAVGLIAVNACSSGSSGLEGDDLVGEWISIDDNRVGARVGTPDADDHATESGGFIFPDAPAAEWTLRITEVGPRGFLGEWCSPQQCEPLAGAIRSDGSAIMADEDSVFTMTREGDDVELCVASPGETFQLAVCHLMRRT